MTENSNGREAAGSGTELNSTEHRARILVKKVSKLLSLSCDEAFQVLKSTFEAGSPADALVDLLGTSQIELVFEIVQIADYFGTEDSATEEPCYVEHVIPPGPRAVVSEEELVPTAAVGDDARYFGYSHFNIVQSRVFPAVYNTDSNTLVCAPTGSGKTDIALLSILRALRDPKAKVVYIAPMKALATEIVTEFSRRLAPFSVVEYTGDTALSSSTVNRASVIIATPEKFDVATRRLAPSLTNLRLVIFDEVHLLGDDRGPVIEVLVARMFHLSELNQCIIRLIALSATLPNHSDVSYFLKATSVFVFDKRYRPVPLRVTVAGFKQKSTRSDESEYLFKNVDRFRQRGKQSLIFVHSRMRTVYVAKAFLAYKKENAVQGTDGGGRGPSSVFPPETQHLVRNGVGIHHAGLPRAQRLAMEALFHSGKIDVLVCTSTLAWGVNLPAYTVFIYGTSFYNTARGCFDDVGILDVVQIFGRAGRPQFDTTGEAFLITRASRVDRYLAMLKDSKDIESRLLFHITDAFCAEVYLGTIFSMASALAWLRNTFLYVRMVRNPAMYGLAMEELTGDGKESPLPAFDGQALADYVLLAVRRLESCGLIRIARPETANHNTWRFEATSFGRIAASHYLNHRTMHQWLGALNTDPLLLLLCSHELRAVMLREEEIPVLATLHEQLLLMRRVDTPFEASREAKLEILVAAYFAFQRPSLFSLVCDTEYIVECFGRTGAALGEVFLFLRRYEAFHDLVLLERRVARVPGAALSSGAYSVSAVRCGAFIDLCITTQSRDRDKKSLAGLFTKLSTEPSFVKPAAKGRFAHKSTGKDYSRTYLFLYSGHAIVYAAELGECLRNYIKTPENSLLAVVYSPCGVEKIPLKCASDHSLSALYRYGVHCCDTRFTLGPVREQCIHFATKEQAAAKKDADCEDTKHRAGAAKGHTSKVHIKLDDKSRQETYNNVLDIRFNLDIQCVPIDIAAYKERLHAMDRLIYKVKGSVLVVCPGNPETTANALNTRLALENNFAEMFGCSDGNGQRSRWVAQLSEARHMAKGFECVVFKGCFGGRAFYPIYDVLSICSGRRAIIYENTEFVEYLNSVIR